MSLIVSLKSQRKQIINTLPIGLLSLPSSGVSYNLVDKACKSTSKYRGSALRVVRKRHMEWSGSLRLCLVLEKFGWKGDGCSLKYVSKAHWRVENRLTEENLQLAAKPLDGDHGEGHFHMDNHRDGAS